MTSGDKLSQETRALLSIFSSESTDIFELCAAGGVDPSYALFNSNLSEVDLSGKNLSGFDLSAANLTGAFLHKSTMFLTDLQFASISMNDLMSKALFTNSSILPSSFFTEMASDARFVSNQSCARAAKLAYNVFNESQNSYEEEIENSDVIYNLAVILDTIGGRVDDGLYVFCEYVLDRLLRRTEKVTEGLQEKIEGCEGIPADVSKGMAWILGNKLTPAQAYSIDDINNNFLDLSSFFWREKLYFKRFYIDRLICKEEFDQAESQVRESIRYSASRGLDWRWAQFRILLVVLELLKNDSLDAYKLVKKIISGLPSWKRREAGADAVWIFYLVSLEVSLPDFRAKLAQIAKALAVEFWDETRINSEAEGILSTLPRFWAMSPEIIS